MDPAMKTHCTSVVVSWKHGRCPYEDVAFRSSQDARLVAKCSLVSKRWQQMCARVQTLHFYSGLFKGHNDYEEIVGKMVLKTCELRSLQVRIPDSRSSSLLAWTCYQ